jgi:outer membrane protein assembly factor BamE (lipoprotein component of BamABCDE complex)
MPGPLTLDILSASNRLRLLGIGLRMFMTCGSGASLTVVVLGRSISTFINAGWGKLMSHLSLVLVLLLALAGVTACSATRHVEDVRAQDADRVTVGTVQKEIKIGMSGAEVATILGSPNIVTTDSERRETWVYDKISTEVAYSKSGGSIVGLIFSSSGGGLGGGYANAGATSTSQRTLTVVIKFDNEGLVRDFSYHASQF